MYLLRMDRPIGPLVRLERSSKVAEDNGPLPLVVSRQERSMKIHGSAANNIYAVGQFGTIVHYDGVSCPKRRLQ